jgi:hypothetical protein
MDISIAAGRRDVSQSYFNRDEGNECRGRRGVGNILLQLRFGQPSACEMSMWLGTTTPKRHLFNQSNRFHVLGTQSLSRALKGLAVQAAVLETRYIHGRHPQASWCPIMIAILDDHCVALRGRMEKCEHDETLLRATSYGRVAKARPSITREFFCSARSENFLHQEPLRMLTDYMKDVGKCTAGNVLHS